MKGWVFSWSSLLTSEHFDSVAFLFRIASHPADQSGMPNGKIQVIVSNKQVIGPFPID
jgi:hypothetical protein